MRKMGRVVVLFLLSLVGTAVLTAVASLVTAVSLAATALIVPGTGTPNANGITGYMTNFRDYYMRRTPCVESDCTAPYNPVTGEGLKGIDYPASFWPIPLPGWCPNLSCDTFNVSVAKGVQSLETSLELLKPLMQPGDKLVIAGYSQGARVASIAKMKYASGEWGDLPVPDSFVFIGNPNRPNGGLLTRLGFLPYIPILNITTGQPTPNQPTAALPAGIPTEDWAIRWEGIADWPTYILNPLAVVNSVLGFYYDHGTYLAFNAKSDPGETPAGYTLEEWRELTKNPQLYPDNVNIQPYGDTTYYTVTPKTLPLVRPLHLIPLIGKPIADLFEPALRVLIEETGYARWLPFGAPVGTGLIPLFNPITLFLKLIPAVFVGINNFLANFGLTKEIPLTPPIPVPPAATSLTEEGGDLEQTSLTNDPGDLFAARSMRQGIDEEKAPGQGGEEQLLVANVETEIDPTLPDGAVAPTGVIEPEETNEGDLPEELNNDPQEGNGPEELTIDPQEGNGPEELPKDSQEIVGTKPEDNRVDANGGSVSLSFSPNDNNPGESQPTGGGETLQQVDPANDPGPATPGTGGEDAPADSEPAAA
ncbi:PE-PPE domain-containing protein [Mycolicibacterium rhodesiae NBB3]|uniref:PE-PPE domain-containing protein n=1 Tax=Mycolicibacterium rhodesiae (strain NBB3) TaxID=710685 RepID=G8RQJ9_MYCRN|nr:PE-PPE domain-containing protein [Mycolicibacterium rhodesiae]AEV71405.1 PE-PPE domain-containing protein [Mycolicibacterium rhodesiae NBB3]